MTAISPAFRGTYTVPYEKLMEMEQKTPDKLKAYGEETAQIVMQGGDIQRTEQGVAVTVPFEKEQEYAAILAKYNIQANKS